MTSLQEVERAFRARLAGAEIPKLMNTRVFLRTGVSLADIRPEQNSDPALVTKVVAALRDFGHPLS